MKMIQLITVFLILTVAALSPAYGWSLKQSNKTHVQICAVDENRKPVEGIEVLCRLNYGRGRLRKCVSDKDGMVSFKDDVGECARCRFSLDEKKFYGVDLTFWPNQSGSVVTGVVKRVVNGPRMVRQLFNKSISNDVRRVGVDLLCGELLPPLGKGRYADIYFANQRFYSDTAGKDVAGRRYYIDYWIERGDSWSEFVIVDKDVGCEFSLPTYAPETMDSLCDRKFRIDYRPNKDGYEPIGKEKCIIVKIVRPQRIFYGVLRNCQFRMNENEGTFDAMFDLNPNPFDRCIAGNGQGIYTRYWCEYVRKVYAEEDAEKEKQGKEVGKPREKADAKAVARNRKMMEEKAYSGRWECKAWGLEKVSLSFGKCGLGFFEMTAENSIFIDNAINGWFHWTADDKGTITARAVDRRYHGMYEMRLNYDCARNAMIPDLRSSLFAGRVAPLTDNLICEMANVSEEDLVDEAQKYRQMVVSDRGEITKADTRMKDAPKRQVESLDALCSLAKERCRGSVGLVVCGSGVPEVKIGVDGEIIEADILHEISRAGDAGAPEFEFLAGLHGPDISGKKHLEVFADPEDLGRHIKSLGGHADSDYVQEEGAWTYERRKYVVARFMPGQWGKCRELLRTAIGSRYTFPLEVREVDWAKSE